jgi:hypothetical protein
MDDASVLTLASSAFAVPGARGSNPLAWAGGSVSNHIGAMDSRSQFDASTQHFADGEGETDEEGEDMGDVDGEEREVSASVRALRPRRSWESEASRWSARVGGPGTASSMHGPVTPSDLRAGLWGQGGAGSVKTGRFSTEVDDEKKVEGAPIKNERSPPAVKPAISSEDGHSPVATENADNASQERAAALLDAPTSANVDPDATPCMPLASLPAEHRTPPSAQPQSPSTPNASIARAGDYFSTQSTPTRKRHDSDESGFDPSQHLGPKLGTEAGRGGMAATPYEECEADFQSIAATDAQTEVWHSAPTTPAAWD